MLHRQLRDLRHRLARHNGAGGVVRGVDHQSLGVRCDELFNGLRLHFKIMLQIRGNSDSRAVAVRDLRHVVQPLRVLNQDFIPLVQQDKEQQAQSAHAAVCDDDLGVRVVVQLLQIGLLGNGLTERERAGVRRIMRDPLVERLLCRLADQLRCRHIRLTDAEADDAGHGICAVKHGADRALLQCFCFFIDPFHDVDVLLLSLHSARAVAAHELFHIGNADTVKVTDHAVLQTGSCNCKFERGLLVLIVVQSIDQAARKAVAAAHTVNNVADLIFL